MVFGHKGLRRSVSGFDCWQAIFTQSRSGAKNVKKERKISFLPRYFTQ
jgi:hypothetical protein